MRPRISKEEYLIIKGIRDAAKEHGVGLEHISSGWLKSKNASVRFKNPLFKDKEGADFTILEELKTALSKIKVKKLDLSKLKPTSNSPNILRVIISDVHIGMTPDKEGFAMYGGVWGEKALQDRLMSILASVKKHYKGHREIHIIDLGDYMDGWDGQTVRKGHNLPQNMSNPLAFKVGVDFKISLHKSIFDITGVIPTSYNVVNDNHSGDFGECVNIAYQNVIKGLFDSDKYVKISKRFMSHYIVGKHCFILTHGKDSKNLKFGFKPYLDEKQVNKVKLYISENKLDDYFITFMKGDTHVQLFDYSQTFNYFNYPALSPSSDWVQTNFQKGRSGFVMDEFDENLKQIRPLSFEFVWGKKPRRSQDGFC